MNHRVYYSKEAEESARRGQRMNRVMLLSLGAGLGAAAALLFSPNDGERTRKMVGDALEEGFARGREAAGSALQQISNEYPDLRDQIVQVLSNVRS